MRPPNLNKSGAPYCRIPCSFQLKPQRSQLFMAWVAGFKSCFSTTRAYAQANMAIRPQEPGTSGDGDAPRLQPDQPAMGQSCACRPFERKAQSVKRRKPSRPDSPRHWPAKAACSCRAADQSARGAWNSSCRCVYESWQVVARTKRTRYPCTTTFLAKTMPLAQ